MKTMKLILLNSLTIVLLISIACTSSPPRPSVEVSYDDFQKVQDTISRLVSKEIEVTVDSSYTVTLWSNQTTGFSWSEPAFHGDETIFELISHDYITSSEDDEGTQAVGASGKEIWTFKALQKGAVDINMEYSQPWEGGEKAAFSFFLHVIVN